MATHCSIIAWRIPGTEEPGVSKGRTHLKQFSMHAGTSSIMAPALCWAFLDHFTHLFHTG